MTSVNYSMIECLFKLANYDLTSATFYELYMAYTWIMYGLSLSFQVEKGVILVCQRTKAGNIEWLDSVFREVGKEKKQEEGT